MKARHDIDKEDKGQQVIDEILSEIIDATIGPYLMKMEDEIDNYTFVETKNLKIGDNHENQN